MRQRSYLDWNATTPLRPEARAAMIAAMDVAGNPSSVHAEGRAAKAIVEKARTQISAALGADGADLVFTSSATEAAALALAGRDLAAAGVEHDAVGAWCREALPVDRDGRVTVADPAGATLQLANSETGVVQDLPAELAVSDLTQAFGKIPFSFNWLEVDMGLISAHKLGGAEGRGRAGSAPWAGRDACAARWRSGDGTPGGDRKCHRHCRFRRGGRGGGAGSCRWRLGPCS